MLYVLIQVLQVNRTGSILLSVRVYRRTRFNFQAMLLATEYGGQYRASKLPDQPAY
jgi:hypothetical protein